MDVIRFPPLITSNGDVVMSHIRHTWYAWLFGPFPWDAVMPDALPHARENHPSLINPASHTLLDNIQSPYTRWRKTLM